MVVGPVADLNNSSDLVNAIDQGVRNEKNMVMNTDAAEIAKLQEPRDGCAGKGSGSAG